MAIGDCFGQKSMCNLLHKQLEAKSKELEITTKNLNDLKVHYDMFTQHRKKEIETLANNCEQSKKVIEEFEEMVTSLRNELQSLENSKEQESGTLRKQIDGISAVNDVLRKTLNEKIEELKQVSDDVRFICLLEYTFDCCIKLLQYSSIFPYAKCIHCSSHT